MEINLTVVNSGAHCYTRFRCFNVRNSRFVTYVLHNSCIHLFGNPAYKCFWPILTYKQATEYGVTNGVITK